MFIKLLLIGPRSKERQHINHSAITTEPYTQPPAMLSTRQLPVISFRFRFLSDESNGCKVYNLYEIQLRKSQSPINPKFITN